MTQETLSTDAENSEQRTEASETQQRTDFNTLPPDVQEYIRKLTKENEKTRKDKAAAKEAAEAAEIAKLAEKQEWQKVASEYKQKLDDLAPLAQRVEETDQLLKEMVERRTAVLQPHLQTLVSKIADPREALAWLDENASALNLPKPPRTGAGEQGDPSAVVSKSVQETIANAQAMGMSAADLAEMQKFLTSKK